MDVPALLTDEQQSHWQAPQRRMRMAELADRAGSIRESVGSPATPQG